MTVTAHDINIILSESHKSTLIFKYCFTKVTNIWGEAFINSTPHYLFSNTIGVRILCSNHKQQRVRLLPWVSRHWWPLAGWLDNTGTPWCYSGYRQVLQATKLAPLCAAFLCTRASHGFIKINVLFKILSVMDLDKTYKVTTDIKETEYYNSLNCKLYIKFYP